MKRTDIYQFDKRLVQAENRMEALGTSRRNKDFVQKFRNYCMMQSFSKARVIKYYRILNHLARMLDKDFDRVERTDIEMVVAKINARDDWSAATKSDTKIMIKRFYKWLLGEDKEFPECIKWLNARLKKTDKKLPNEGDLITEEDVNKAIESAYNLRDKALLSTLYESGCRVGELMSLRIKDMSFDKLGTVLCVTGKTGPRKIRIVTSTTYLTNWINNHPLKDDREAPVWISIGSVNRNKRIDYDTVWWMINEVFKRAGIQKRHNPHSFRHARATFLANHLTEFQMNQYFGWVQGSDMASTYVHLSGREVEDAILKVNGLRQEKKEPVSKSVVCKRCDTINNSGSIYCCKCGCVVDAVTALKLEEENKKEGWFKDSSKEVLMRIAREKPDFLTNFTQELIRKAKGSA